MPASHDQCAALNSGQWVIVAGGLAQLLCNLRRSAARARTYGSGRRHYRHNRGRARPQAVDDLRVRLLGKTGEITPKLKSLGAMDPRARALRPRKLCVSRTGQHRNCRAQGALETAELERELATETNRPVASGCRGARERPSGRPSDGRARRNLRGSGFSVATGRRSRPMVQFHRAQHAGKPPGPRDAGHLLSRTARGEEPCAPDPYVAGADPNACKAGAPSGHCARPRLPLGQRRHAHADVPSDRRSGDRQGITLGHLKWTLETFLKAFFERDDIVLRLRQLLPVHRALGRSRCRLVDRQGPARASAGSKAGWKFWAREWSIPR